MNLEALRAYCLSLPFATEDIKWESELTFCVGGKIFAMASLNPGQNGTVCFKVTPEDFVSLIECDGIVPAPYVARYHWILIEDPDAMKPAELKRRLAESHARVLDALPRKIRLEMGIPEKQKSEKTPKKPRK